MSYVSNLINRSGSAAVKNDFESTYTKVTRCSNSQFSSMMPLPILKNISIIPVSKVPNDSSKIMNLNKKGIEPILCQSKEQLAMSNLKMPNEISISPVNDIENSIMLLKRLPNITLQVVNPKPVFKVPESPKLNPKKVDGPYNKSKTISKSKVLSEKQNNNIILEENNNLKLLNNTKSLTEKNQSFLKSPLHKRKLEQNTLDVLTVSTKNNHDTIISRIPVEVPDKSSCSEIKNVNTQKTSSPYKLPKKSLSCSNIKLNNLTTINPAKKRKISNVFSSYHGVKINSENSLNTNNIENKTPESTKDYLLMDLSSESKINIVPAFPPVDFLNVSLPKYDSFAMGISKSPGESDMHLETSLNYIEKQEIDFSNNQKDKQENDFLNNQNYVVSSLPNINKYIDTPIDSNLNQI